MSNEKRPCVECGARVRERSATWEHSEGCSHGKPAMSDEIPKSAIEAARKAFVSIGNLLYGCDKPECAACGPSKPQVDTLARAMHEYAQAQNVELQAEVEKLRENDWFPTFEKTAAEHDALKQQLAVAKDVLGTAVRDLRFMGLSNTAARFEDALAKLGEVK